MYLNCAKCGCRLTAECIFGEDADYCPEAQDRESPLKRGIIVVQRQEIAKPINQNGKVIGSHVESGAGDFSVNPEDVLPGVLSTTGVDNGCCGSDGCDGPNRRCTCGGVLGTEWSDCWTQAEIRFTSDAVIVQFL
jgi:hypothetical protein